MHKLVKMHLRLRRIRCNEKMLFQVTEFGEWGFLNMECNDLFMTANISSSATADVSRALLHVFVIKV